MQLTPIEAGLMFVTGAVGAGKTTIPSLISSHLSSDRKVFTIDSSRCIELSIKYETEAGRALRKFREDKTGGKLLPPELAFWSIWENAQWIEKEFKPQVIIVPGGYRATDEAALWNDAQGLVKWRLFAITSDNIDDDIEFGVFLRNWKGDSRVDDADPQTVAKRTKEYKEKTLPAVKCAPPELVKSVARATSLLHRVTALADHLPIDSMVRQSWNKNLYWKFGPLRREIRQTESTEAIVRAEFDKRKAAKGGRVARPLVPINDLARSEAYMARA